VPVAALPPTTGCRLGSGARVQGPRSHWTLQVWYCRRHEALSPTPPSQPQHSMPSIKHGPRSIIEFPKGNVAESLTLYLYYKVELSVFPKPAMLNLSTPTSHSTSPAQSDIPVPREYSLHTPILS
jgi:hypothetical protein